MAGPALDDDKSPSPTTDSTLVPPPATPVEYGIGVRLRNVRIPKAELELFVERAGDTGASNYGLGIDLTRRRGNLELQLGIEFERITPGEGVWIERGKDVSAGDEADYILDPKDTGNSPLGWVTFEFTFLNHAPITKHIAIRYGGGLGLGVVLGQLDHYNIICTNATNENVDPGCIPERFAGMGQYTEGTETLVKYNLPPVFPVVNAILGVQLRPIEKLTINVEGGIRTFLFFGMSTSYFF